MKLFLTICTFFLAIIGHTQLSGDYTIGGAAPNYATINDAVNALINQGVDGSVTFNIRPGIYTEYLHFNGDDISGLSWTNTVTFQSEKRDSLSVQMNYPNTGQWSDYSLIQVENAHHLIFRLMAITRTGSNQSAYTNNLVNFSHAKHITFENCSFEGSTDLSYLSGIGIHLYEGGSHIKITNCSFNSMESCFQSESVPTDTAISIHNSVFSNFRESAITILYLKDSLELKNNYFTNDTVKLPSWQIENTRAIGITNCQGVIEVMKNRIEGRYGSTALHVSCMNGTPAYLVKIYNNFISVENGTTYSNVGETVAIDLSNDNYVDIQYNSINTYGNLLGTVTRFCWAAVDLAYECNNIRFVNNIIQTDSLQEYFNVGSNNVTTDVFSCFDHNNYYNTNGYIIPMTNLAFWPENWNTNSTTINPMFYSRNDLHIQNPELAVAIPTLVMDDIDGDPRTHPTLGADEGNFASVLTNVENEYSIYPNPANDVLHVITNSEEFVLYTITDSNGKLIQNGQVSSGSNVIELKDLETGIYYIRLSNSDSATRFVR